MKSSILYLMVVWSHRRPWRHTGFASLHESLLDWNSGCLVTYYHGISTVDSSLILVPPQNVCITILYELNSLVLSQHILLPNSIRDLRILLTHRIGHTYLFQVLINPVHVITQDADTVRTRHVTAHVLTITSAERNHLHKAKKIRDHHIQFIQTVSL